MTDAAVPVTEQVVEQFVEEYLVSLGAEIDKKGRKWTVSLSDDADTGLELDGSILEVAQDPDDVENDAFAIAPKSEFVERLLDEAAARVPVGSVTLTGKDFDIRLPPWLTEGPVEISKQSFTPYYDRRALCALIHIGIETVSDYQTEELLAVAVDLSDNDERPRLAETYLELSQSSADQELREGSEIEQSKLSKALDSTLSIAEDEIQATVRDIRKRSTRAAEVELDEYRQFIHQRLEELDDESQRLAQRISDVNETIDEAAEQGKRIEALRKRKKLQEERDAHRTEQEELTAEIRNGFPERRQEVRDRHALTVRLRPVAITTVTYERGDLDLFLDNSTTVTYPYAIGIGVVEDPICERCGRQLSAENPLTIYGDLLIGATCCSD